MEKQDVFISFASQERKLADAIKQFIETAFECKAFVSDTSITAGEIWQEEIVAALCNAKLLLVLCSPLSISRQWVNFECGAAHLSGKKILFLCHSGLSRDQLQQKIESHPWLNQEDAWDVHDSFFDNESKKYDSKLVNKINELLPCIKMKGDFNSVEHKNNIDAAINEVVIRKFKQNTKDKPFLKFNLTKTGNTIQIKPTGQSIEQKKPDGCIEEVKKMDLFLRNEEITIIKDVGVAIGIQNCLFDGTNIYVGVRMKAIEDANATSVGVAMGSFNTGYQLMKFENDKLKFESESTLQDLFISKKEIKRSLYKRDYSNNNTVKDTKQKIIEIMKSRLEAFNSNLWFIDFSNNQGIQEIDELASVATIFINNSRWFPRFEIGVWKFIDLSQLEDKDKDKLEKNILPGFGEDIFLDYRGQEDVEGMNVNYWIWAKNGEVKYWSYPEERHIPRYKPTKYSEPKNAVLVTAKKMSESYGNQRKYTPFASTEYLTDYNVIDGQFSLPARALLSCF